MGTFPCSEDLAVQKQPIDTAGKPRKNLDTPALPTSSTEQRRCRTTSSHTRVSGWEGVVGTEERRVCTRRASESPPLPFPPANLRLQSHPEPQSVGPAGRLLASLRLPGPRLLHLGCPGTIGSPQPWCPFPHPPGSPSPCSAAVLGSTAWGTELYIVSS